MPPRLEDFTDKLDQTCMATLGETIQYAANGVIADLADLDAYVDYRDLQSALDRSEVIRQDIMVTVLKADLPDKPTSAARLTLPRRPDRTFKPANPRSDESGTHWEFEVVSADA